MNHPSKLFALFPLIVLLFCAHQLRAQDNGRTLVDTDFTRTDAPRAEQKSERVSGSLPAPWRDTSEWAKVWVTHQPQSEKGQTFQRLTVSQLQDGRAQIVHLLPDLNPDALLSLRMTVRGSRELPLTLGIRQQNAPYQYLWSQTLALDSEWRELKWTFPAPKTAQPVMLIVELTDVGQLDIAGIQMRETSPEALTRERDGAISPNLLRNSRLPLGLQSGWWFNQGLWNWWLDYGTPPLPENADSLAKISADNAVAGPSGAPTTRIDAPRGFGLYSAPFAVPLPFGPHTASVAMKGSGRGVWIVWGDGKELARHDFDLKDGAWQRQQATFTPDINIRVYALRWEGTGTFWLDEMQVERGATMTPFQVPAAAEIALSAPASDDAPRNVQWDEDRPVVDFVVMGDEAKTLQSRVISIEGDSKMLPAMVLNAENLQRGQLDFGVFDNQMLGVFRIEAWVENARGQRSSEIYEIVVNRLHKARYWKKDAPPSSPFGTHVLAITTDIQMAKAIGINWVRGHDIGMDYLGWHYLEPAPGQWKFRDTELHRYRAQHLRILGMLQTAPAWASQLKQAHDAYWDMFYQPKDPTQFGHYVRTVAERYKGVIDAYEVWSEPWNFPWFAVSYDESAVGKIGGDASTPNAIAGYRTSAQPQKDYARLMQEAYENVKAVAPDATVLGFNTTTATAISGTRRGGQEWTHGILENGGLEACDVISYHQYLSAAEGGLNAENIAPQVESGFDFALGPLLAPDKTAPKPIWLSEGNPITELSRDSGFYRHTLPYPAGETLTYPSDRLCRWMVSLLSKKVQKVFLYSMHGGNFFGQSNEFGTLMHRDGSLHPAGVAYAQMAWQLEDTQFVRQIALKNGARAYLFKGQNRAVAVLFSRAQHSDSGVIFPAAETVRAEQLEISDLWGNAVAAGSRLGDTTVYLSGPSVAAVESALQVLAMP